MIDESLHTNTKEITCPYCGDTEPYSYEYCHDEPEDICCSTCTEVYTAMTTHPITYTTKRIPNEIT